MARVFFSPFGEVKSAVGKVAVSIIVISVLIVCSPFMLLLHKPLRRLGRNGFYFDEKIVLGTRSFRKRI